MSICRGVSGNCSICYVGQCRVNGLAVAIHIDVDICCVCEKSQNGKVIGLVYGRSRRANAAGAYEG